MSRIDAAHRRDVHRRSAEYVEEIIEERSVPISRPVSRNSDRASTPDTWTHRRFPLLTVLQACAVASDSSGASCSVSFLTQLSRLTRR
jgi:hypothetical protein